MTHLKIESNIPLSQSCLWQAQRHYFEEEGIHAWQQVPFFVTSNPFIADRYARLIIAYLQDMQHDPAEPIYIVELGAGTGQFSYYCNLALKKYLQQTRFAGKICYVMTLSLIHI
jgi:SAM-dependent MidA family methyltransferase